MHDLNFSPSPISSRDGVTSRRYAGERAPFGFGFGRRVANARISSRRQTGGGSLLCHRHRGVAGGRSALDRIGASGRS